MSILGNSPSSATRNDDLTAENAEKAFRNDNFKLAIAEYKAFLKNDPKNWYVHQRLAECLKHLGRYSESIEESNECIQLGGKGRVYLIRARSYAAIEKTSEAISDLNQAISADPKDSLARIERVRLKLKLKRYDEVVKECTATLPLLKYDGDKAEILYARSQAYKGLNDNVRAALDKQKAEHVYGLSF